MANKKNASEDKAPAVVESTYTVDEFVAAADNVFGAGTSPDIIRAAFRTAGLDQATVEEAKKLVKAFAEREVN